MHFSEFGNVYINENLDKNGDIASLTIKFKCPKGTDIVNTVDNVYDDKGKFNLQATYEKARQERDGLVFKYHGREVLSGLRKGFFIGKEYPRSGIPNITLVCKGRNDPNKKTYLYLKIDLLNGDKPKKQKLLNLRGRRTDDVYEEALNIYCKNRGISKRDRAKLKWNPFFGIFIRNLLLEIIDQENK